MARPQKDGIDYFPLDVDFFEDKKVKLVKAEFGAVGIVVLIAVLADLYRDNGYYKRWDSDDCLLMSEGVGCGCSPNTVEEVVQGCIRRSLFDEGVFNAFGVLTSPGIQRRYLRAVAERSNIEICEEYCLLDRSNQKDVPERILKKLTLKSISPQKNEVNRPNNGVNLPNNPKSKGKESKVKKSKEIGAEPAVSTPSKAKKLDAFSDFAGDNGDLLSALQDFEIMRKSIKKPLTDRAKKLILSDLQKLSQDASMQIAILDQSIKSNWQGVFPLKTGHMGQMGNKPVCSDFSSVDAQQRIKKDMERMERLLGEKVGHG